MAEVTYHKWHKVITNNNVEIKLQTQLYQIGVYTIINNNPSMQGNYSPNQLKKLEKKLQKQVDKGELKSLELGDPITVTNKSGFWEKKED